MMWDIWEKRTEEGWVRAASKFTKEVLDTTRTWLALILGAAAVRFMAKGDSASGLLIGSYVLEWLATLALLRFFLWEAGVRNVLRRSDRIGVWFDIFVNFALFGVSYLFLSRFTAQLVEAAVALQAP